MLAFYKQTWWLWLLLLALFLFLAIKVSALFYVMVPGLILYSVYFGVVRDVGTERAGQMSDWHFYEVSAGHRLPHDPFKAIVAPRPIGWVSTIGGNGLVNLAPYSFFNGVCDTPPMVMFSSSGRKDSLRNVQETGEFVCNLATRPLAEAMNQTSRPLPHGENEMSVAGLTAAPCRLVKPPRVAEAPAALECRLVKVMQLPTIEGTLTQNFMVIGQVVAVHIDATYLKNGLFDMTAAGTIARCGYLADYAHVSQLFQMPRPKA